MKIGNALEINKDDYEALQKVSKTELGQLISNQFAVWRAERLIVISKKFSQFCEKNKIKPKAIAPKFLIPFIEASTLDDDEDIQNLWVKLLSEESDKPDSVSIRTIEVLKNMSKEEALIFKNVSKSIIQIQNQLVIFRDTNDKSISPIISLVDCGLIVSDNSLVTLTIDKPEDKYILSISNSKKLAIIVEKTKESTRTISIPIFSLTRAGCDLFKVIKNEEESDKCFIEIAKKIAGANKDFAVSLNAINKIENNTINYDKKNLLQCA